LIACSVASPKRSATTFHYAVLLLDLDGFKTFNDTMGAAAGDQVILEIARRLELCRCASDSNRLVPKTTPGEVVLARLGGDEFGISAGTGQRTQRRDAAR